MCSVVMCCLKQTMLHCLVICFCAMCIILHQNQFKPFVPKVFKSLIYMFLGKSEDKTTRCLQQEEASFES